ncbi:hypothetical protein RQP54_14935 [Curvibacter sp. APW13]|uniref:hypothetical protein n=1 Tax=Curvibacter sp. APW13 TaxID=3077236 RepID=UPI0028DFEE37|nr:hypothetical protein [Curvibacter sp. APW13]MDT8992165.1 hypothetical protein [Curvibacter sp. APW13]
MTRLFSQWLRLCMAHWHRRPGLERPALPRISSAPVTATAACNGTITSLPTARTCVAPRAHAARTPSTRIIEWETASNGSARTLGRVVMVGKFSEICAELDRLTALETA